MKILAFLSGLFVLIFVLFVSRVFYVEEIRTNRNFENSIGTYKLLFDKSDIKSLNEVIIDTSSVYLKLNSDSTFLFTRSLEYLKGATGKWETTGWGLTFYNVLMFGNDQIGPRVSICCDDTDKIKIKNIRSYNEEISLGEIVFEKIIFD